MSIGRASFVALRNDRTTVSDERGYRVQKDDEDDDEEEKDCGWNVSPRLSFLSGKTKGKEARRGEARRRRNRFFIEQFNRVNDKDID